jgi:hypothetical protein
LSLSNNELVGKSEFVDEKDYNAEELDLKPWIEKFEKRFAYSESLNDDDDEEELCFEDKKEISEEDLTIISSLNEEQEKENIDNLLDLYDGKVSKFPISGLL